MSGIVPLLGQVPSGLFILTARHGDLETGMLASWVMQAGFEPPMLSVCIRQGRYIAEWLSAGAPFAVHVLSSVNKNLLSHFGRGFDPGQPAFAGLEILRTESGLPILNGTLGYLECQSRQYLDSADHRIFLAEIVAGQKHADLGPLVHIRKSGLRY
jgi:flavin reductase (DIM6/NTAB) family NADH-FMN oxidoreductase RutF